MLVLLADLYFVAPYIISGIAFAISICILFVLQNVVQVVQNTNKKITSGLFFVGIDYAKEKDKTVIRYNNYKIKQISPNKLNKVIDTRKPLGLFIIDNGCYWIGIDNTTGDAWVEDFKTKKECLEWLVNR